MLQTKPKKIITKEGALAELCKRSLYRFTREFLSEIEPAADNYVWNWHIKYLCDQLQELVFAYRDDKSTYHLNLNISPGATKSTIFSRISTAWIWTVFPQATVINVTRDSNNVKNFSLKCKELITSQKYKKLFPEVEIKKEPDSMFYFENTIGGVRYGLTTSSSGSTGKHADFIIFDDIYAYKDLESPATITSLQTSIEGYLSRFKNKEKGVLINVMQRLGIDDPTAFLFTGYKDIKPKLKNYKNICLPAVLNEMLDPLELKNNYVDGLLDPVRLNKKILEQEKVKYGYKYDAQFDQNPVMNQEGLMYPVIPYYNYDTPEGINYTFTDVADTGDDYLCTWFCKLTESGVYIYDAIYTKEGSGVTIPILKQRLKNNNSAVNWIEVNNQGSVFISQLRDEVPSIDGKFETSNKTTRIFSYRHLLDFVHFKETGSYEYLKAIEHLRHLPKLIPNNGKGMDIDSADALTAMLRYFYYNFPQYFTIS